MPSPSLKDSFPSLAEAGRDRRKAEVGLRLLDAILPESSPLRLNLQALLGDALPVETLSPETA